MGFVLPLAFSWQNLLFRLNLINLTQGWDVFRWNLTTYGSFTVDFMDCALSHLENTVNNKKQIWRVKIPTSLVEIGKEVQEEIELSASDGNLLNNSTIYHSLTGALAVHDHYSSWSLIHCSTSLLVHASSSLPTLISSKGSSCISREPRISAPTYTLLLPLHS